VITKYLGLKHSYGDIDCIRLIHSFYENELGVSFAIPDYTLSKRWMLGFTIAYIDEWANQYGKKVHLTDAKNYDLIVFKSNKDNLITHFGMFLAPNQMLHIEEKNYSKIETLSDYWIKSLYCLYRHNDVV
jgi:cell wall-associated NlpC family hydrolase